MKFGDSLRNCDLFGASVSLTHDGKSMSGTLAGGLISLSVQLLVVSYLIMRIIAVVGY